MAQDQTDLLAPARRWAALAIGAIPVAVFAGCTLSSAFRGQFDIVRSVDAAVFARERRQILPGVAVDSIFVASWLVTVGVLASAVRRWPGLRDDRTPYRHVGWTALGAGLLDLVENGLLLLAREVRPTALLALLATVGWLKLAAYAAALAGGLELLAGPTVGRLLAGWAEGFCRVTFDHWNGTPRRAAAGGVVRSSASPGCPTAVTGPPSGTGICLSGGGIRAAGIAIGALGALDRPTSFDGRSVFRSADWLCAVSGGGYTAAGWRLSRAPDGAEGSYPGAVGASAADGLFACSRWRSHVLRRHRYLENGTLALFGGAAGAIGRTILVLGGIAGSAVLVGWAAGSFASSDWIRPQLGDRAAAQALGWSTVVVPALYWPGLVAIACGTGVLLVGLAVGRDRRIRRAGRTLAVVGAGLLTVLQGLPLLLAYAGAGLAQVLTLFGGGEDPHQQDPGVLGAFLSALSALGIGSALAGLARAQLQKYWLRLGGLLLALLWVLLAVTVAYGSLRGGREDGGSGLPLGAAGPVPALVLVSAGLLLVLSFVDQHRLTLAGMYRKRVSATFATRLRHDGPGRLGYGAEPGMQEYQDAAGPMLVVAATAHSSTPTVSGLKGAGITFDPQHIHLYDGSHDGAGSCLRTADFPPGSWWRGYPRTWSYSRAMALSGAAVASAMGRQALGTTNALLAALNLRLGMWVPNPAQAGDFARAPGGRPCRVGLKYLVKELFGRYDLARDPFIYVADGGHRDNLGLVELLRRRPLVVYVVDASGDPPGTFRTLREAIDLAALELRVRIAVDWDPVRHGTQDPFDDTPPRRARKKTPPTLPAGCVTTGVITYPDGQTAELRYARNQLSADAPAELHRFAGTNPRFPGYSTGNQFLTDAEFEHLVALGDHLGDRLLHLDLPADWPLGAVPSTAGGR